VTAHRLAPAVYTASMLAALLAAAPARGENGWLERAQLTGTWRGVRPALSEHGFEPYLVYTGAMWSNLAGGEAVGTEFDGYLDLGFDLHLERLGAWHGGGLHADFHWYQGREPTEVLVGGSESMAIDEWEASNALRVYNLYFRQTFGDERWALEAGQIAVDSHFMLADYAGAFLNAAFGDLPLENINSDAPVYPLAAPGVYLEGRPDPALAWKFGAYTADAGFDVASNHGFGWELGNNAGYAFYSELTARSSPHGLSGDYTLGGFYIAADTTVIASGQTRYGNYGLYAMIDQTLASDARGHPKVGGFARFSVSPQKDRNLAFIYADAGLNLLTPFPSRPNDLIGLAFGVLRSSGAAGGPIDVATTSSDERTLLPSGQGVVELTYQAAITPWLIVQPDAQLVIDPVFGGSDAVVFGLQAIVVF
jgi:porin